MRRRRLLASLGAAALATGCVGGPSSTGASPGGPTDAGTPEPTRSPEDESGPATGTPGEDPPGTGTPTTLPPDAYDALGYVDAADLGRIDAGFAQRAVGPYYLAVAATADGAAALADRLEREDGRAFLDATDFAAAAVVAFHDAHARSVPDLAVRSVRRGHGSVDLDVVYPGDGGTADVTAELLLLRVPRGDDAPAHATASITGQSGETTTISTVGRYGRASLTEPRDVVVRNRDCTAHRIDVGATVDGELVFTPTDQGHVDPGTTVRYRDVLREAGAHRVAVDRSGTEVAATTSLANDGSPQGVLVDVDGGGTVAVTTRPEADLPVAGTGDCAAADVPYESSDPAENVARPAHVGWVNRSDANRSVRVVVRDDDAVVIDRRIDLPAGDKGRTDGLVARRGAYRTRISPDEGASRTVDWVVDDAGADLQLLVEASGELAVGGAVER